MKQHASPLAGEAVQPTAWPGEGELDSRFRGNDIQGDFGGIKGLDSCLRRNDTSIGLKCYFF